MLYILEGANENDFWIFSKIISYCFDYVAVVNNSYITNSYLVISYWLAIGQTIKEVTQWVIIS